MIYLIISILFLATGLALFIKVLFLLREGIKDLTRGLNVRLISAL